MNNLYEINGSPNKPYYNLGRRNDPATISNKDDGLSAETHGIAIRNMRVLAEVKKYDDFNSNELQVFQAAADEIKRRFEAKYDANLNKKFFLFRLAIKVFNFVRVFFGFSPKPEMDHLYDVASKKIANAKAVKNQRTTHSNIPPAQPQRSPINHHAPARQRHPSSPSTPRINLKPGQIGPITIVNNVYTAEGRTRDGEKIYFAMENLACNPDKAPNASLFELGRWQCYSYKVNSLIEALLNQEKQNCPNEQNSGSTEKDETLKELSDKMHERGICKKNKPRYKALKGVRSGKAGFTPSDANFVAYISKTPVTGPLPKYPEVCGKSQFKDWKKNYEHIVMSVGTTMIDGLPVFENRGIFRNPISVIEGGYARVANQLHAFTGRVINEQENPKLGVKEKKLYLRVNALPHMREMLEKTCQEKGIPLQVGKDQIDPKLLKNRVGFGVLDTPMLMPVQNLVSLHEGSSEK